MNFLKALHTLVDWLDCTATKQQLHTLLDDLNEEQVLETLTRLRDLRHHSLAAKAVLHRRRHVGEALPMIESHDMPSPNAPS